MTTKEIMALIECYRTAGGREEHHAYKEELGRVLDDLVAEHTRHDSMVSYNDQLNVENRALKAELEIAQEAVVNNCARNFELQRELETLKAQEPVAHVEVKHMVEARFHGNCEYGCALEDGTKLYLAAGAKEVPKPPTQEQIKSWKSKHPTEDLCGWSYGMGVLDTIRHYTKEKTE